MKNFGFLLPIVLFCVRKCAAFSVKSPLLYKEGLEIFQSLSRTASFSTTGWLLTSCVVNAAEDVEIAELPPPYIPVLFAVGLLVGVGVLTSSLGDVMEEESSLGLQSGARAKKEIERSRSSYFKKR